MMAKTNRRRLRWEATQGAERIILIKEGRLLLDRSVRRSGKAPPRKEVHQEPSRAN